MIFSPHPDDETISCGGVIFKALQEHKTVKVVFLTNGDSYADACAAWLNKVPESLTAQDYISLGSRRCKEALAAAKTLGLKDEDLFFLGFPDKGLLPLWEEKYGLNYQSPTTQKSCSPYELTFKRAKEGYNRQNLLADIREILNEYRPREIYLPHPLDTNSDHRATAFFVNLALDGINGEKQCKWIGALELSYYVIHGLPDNTAVPYAFSQAQPSSVNIIQFRKQKEQALGEYLTQLNTQKDRSLIKNSVTDQEFFWRMPADKSTYLEFLKEEWHRIGKRMHEYGFNVNFGPVADVADNIEDRDIYLVKGQRIYSQSPDAVIELSSSVIKGLSKAGIIPVLKHFPGLGCGRSDPHTGMPVIEKSRKQLYDKDILPFKRLIREKNGIWIMVDHAVYPALSDKPASLSYEIQTRLLRNELGFQGIIIADELLNMQSLMEFANREKIKDPYIGEIVVRAFQAGTDIALIYPEPENAQAIINNVIGCVNQAVSQGRLDESGINDSVVRILKEKERIFGKSLLPLVKEMSLEEKICQKIAVDIYKDTKLIERHSLCGVRPRKEIDIVALQRQVKIPLFIFAQHEGGTVNERLIKLSTISAYNAGKEYGRLAGQNSSLLKKSPPRITKQTGGTGRNDDVFKAKAPKKGDYDNTVNSLIDCLDTLIALYSELMQKGSLPAPHPNYRTPLTVNSDGGFEIKPFRHVPIMWLQKFPDERSALYAYNLFKEIYDAWLKEQKIPENGTDKIILRLNSLKKKIENYADKKIDRSNIRVLCLAAHPDDEDAEALAYFAKQFNCKTYILLATRGEGGENALNSSYYDDLGGIRTREIQNAASVLGVKRVYYLGKKDFGYSLDPQETFKNWGRQDTLEKLVYFIRLIRPHIIISKHNKSNLREHGQHRALSMLAEEAFVLAGSPAAYPEMIKAGIVPWQPLKFYARCIGNYCKGDNRIFLDTQETIPSEHKNLSRLALEALSQHLSQQYLRRPSLADNRKKISYQLVKSKIPSSVDETFFDWINRKDDPPFISGKEDKRILPSGLPGVKIIDGLRIGLFEKNNDTLFIALSTLGSDFKNLDENFFITGDLSQFDTIILGQGVYTFSNVLPQFNNRLLEFVEKGGNLIVFPQYSNGLPEFAYAPYPFKISFEPVADENEPVKILFPQHPLFICPNEISMRDFAGWVQDRGLFFPTGYSEKYTELTRCISSRGSRVNGGYLSADYGKGSYIYTGFAWYRQLKAFHAGAYKNLANMLAYPYSKKNIKY